MLCLTAILVLCLTLQVVTSGEVVQEEDDFTLVPGSPARRCCGPNAYEAFGMTGVTGTPARNFSGSYHVDVKHQRLALYQTFETGDNKAYSLIIIIRDNHTYVIHPSRKQCTKTPFLRRISTCINKRAMFVLSLKLGGAGGSTITVNGWGMGGPVIFQTIFFSADKCVMTVAVRGDAKQTSAAAFGDVKLGIKHQGVFNLPPYCPHNKTVEEEAIHHLAQEMLEAHQARQRFFE